MAEQSIASCEESSSAASSVQPPQTEAGSENDVNEMKNCTYPERERLRPHPYTVEAITSIQEVKRGDHILHQVTQTPYRPMYYSALVKSTNDAKGTVKVVTNCMDGVVEKEFMFDQLQNLYRVEYCSQCDVEETFERANKRLDENYYHSLHNNSHQMVTFCKTGQEHSLTDILKNLEYRQGNQHCNSLRENLQHVVIKKKITSLNDVSQGSHLLRGNLHYLVESVNIEGNTFSAFSLCKKKKVKLFKRIELSNEIVHEVLQCTSHTKDINVDEVLRECNNEMFKMPQRKWGDSSCFVTAMLCRVEHKLEERFMMRSDLASNPDGCTVITPKVPVKPGDHLVVKEFSNAYKSVVVQGNLDSTRVIVAPPLHNGEIIDLTCHPEILRVEYKECLPAEETVERSKSSVGRIILERRSNECSNCLNHSSCFVNWTKLGRAFPINVEDLLREVCSTKRRKFQYTKISSPDEIKQGEHLVECCQGRQKHFMVTERLDDAKYKVISCRHTKISEDIQKLELSESSNLYQISYTDALTEFESAGDTASEQRVFLKRARSRVGEYLHCPWGHMLFFTWVKTGAKEDFETNVSSQPVSMSKIMSFDQVASGDYLLVKPNSSISFNEHYLVISIESPIQCTVAEFTRQKVEKKELALLDPKAKSFSYYRINYEPGACVPNIDSVNHAKSYFGRTVLRDSCSKTFVHRLKTHTELEVVPDDIPLSSEYHLISESSKSLSKCPFTAKYQPAHACAPKCIQAVTSLDMLSVGDHIIYRRNKSQIHPVYCSALVLKKEQNEQLKILDVTRDGIHETTYNFKSLSSLHKVAYHSCLSDCEVVARAARLVTVHGQEEHFYHEVHNNSHHFVTRCKTAQNNYNSLIKFLNEIAGKEQESLVYQDVLKPVLTKVPPRSIEDIGRGDHLLINDSNHYLVDSVVTADGILFAFSISSQNTIIRQRISDIREKISKGTMYVINYDLSSSVSDVDVMFERVKREIDIGTKWQCSDHFVTMMKCGTGYSIDDRCYISQEVTMKSTTQLTSHSSVDIGDHILVKHSERFHSVLLCSFVEDRKAVIIPPINPSQHKESEIIDLNTHGEIYRVNYSHELPSEEVIRRGQSSAGKAILEDPELAPNNTDHFVTWAKTGKKMPVPAETLIEEKQIEISHPLAYKKILSTKEFHVGQHIFLRWQCLKPYREHLLVTECNVDPENPTKCRVISCIRTGIKEEVRELNPSFVGSDIYQVIYQDELPPDTAVERARSLEGKHKFRLDARMWFVPWAKTGSDDGIEVDFLRNLTMPASKSRIVCFTQLNPGDYLVEESNPYIGRYHHYLVESVQSPEKCTVFESWNGSVVRKELVLQNASPSIEDHHPWFYRINYEAGICIQPELSIKKARNLLSGLNWPFFLTSEYARRSCIHFLKTTESVDIHIGKLVDDRILLKREIVTSAFELKRGDHIERPMSFASSFAQHHMLVLEAVDQSHCKVIHYKVNATPIKTAQMKKGKVAVEIINIFEEKVCYRVCYPERIDPMIGMNKLMQLCGEEAYNLIVNNCEHVVMIATLGIPLSIQVEKFVYHALRTTKGMVKVFRTSCLHHGVHITQEYAIHGAIHHAAKLTFKHGMKAAAKGSVLGPIAGIAFALNVLFEGPLLVRTIYKLKRKKIFGKMSVLEYQRERATVVFTTLNSVAGGTLGAVAGQVVIWQAPIAGAAVGGLIGNIAGHGLGHLQARLFCSIMYPDCCEITLPEILEKKLF